MGLCGDEEVGLAAELSRGMLSPDCLDEGRRGADMVYGYIREIDWMV